ncbi:hypothetical protein [Candidatus Thiosymbion oneisti]|uniref:hypothetical protein n=1 Tax=Candidatus Thiosymbion oneisti TaxID=589554 RepID=UPI000AA91DE7|nr:hypothetical protein [Candidatus Thiosymbion oneisti]
MADHLFAICIRNDNYQVSLEKRKLYEVLQDSDAEIHDQIRIIDESGEDYIYPRDYFVVVDLPDAVELKVLDAA